MRKLKQILGNKHVVDITEQTETMIEFTYKCDSDYYTVSISDRDGHGRVSISYKDDPWREINSWDLKAIANLCFEEYELIQCKEATFSSIKTLRPVFAVDDPINCDVHCDDGSVENMMCIVFDNELAGYSISTDQNKRIPFTRINYIVVNE